MRAFAIAVALTGCKYSPTAVTAGDDVPGDTQLADSTAADSPPDTLVSPPPTPCVQQWLAGTMNFDNPGFLDQAGPGSLATFSDERDPFVSSDELQIYFSKPGSGGDLDVVFSTRATAGDPFSAPATKDSLSDSNATDGKATMTLDDLTAVVVSARGGGEGGLDFWQATRSSGGVQAFPTLTQDFLQNVNDAGNQQDPHLSPDGLRLYYSTGSPQKLVVASRTSAASEFSPPVDIANIADASGDADPTLTGDERVLIFTSNRAGTGGTDLWYATRAERDQPFGAPINLTQINTTDDDSDAYITADGCHLYFSSTRDPNSTDFDIFFTKMSR